MGIDMRLEEKWGSPRSPIEVERLRKLIKFDRIQYLEIKKRKEKIEKRKKKEISFTNTLAMNTPQTFIFLLSFEFESRRCLGVFVLWMLLAALLSFLFRSFNCKTNEDNKWRGLDNEGSNEAKKIWVEDDLVVSMLSREQSWLTKRILLRESLFYQK
ncbi:hypothetical protein QQP08_002367, partial [Theobroma cacao]